LEINNVENLIGLRLAEYDREFLQPAREGQTRQLAKLQSTIDKIYGNGSGNKGMLENMRDEIGEIGDKVEHLCSGKDKQLGAHYEREVIKGWVVWIAGGVGAILAVVIGGGILELVKKFILGIH
jgi:hypothetical protein